MTTTYESIESCLYPYLRVDPDDFNRSPESIRQWLIDKAREEYLKNTIFTVREPVTTFCREWSWKDHTIYRTLDDISFCEYQYIGYGEMTPEIITSENATDFVMFLIDRMHRKKPSDDWRLYQITLKTTNGYVNAKSPDLIHTIIKHLEVYDDTSIEVIHVLGHYISHEHRKQLLRKNIQKIKAGNGEGVSMYMSNGYWIYDTLQSKTLCILNVFVAWCLYHYKSFDKVMDMQKFSQLRNKIRKPLATASSIEKIHNVYKQYPYTVVFQDDKLDSITPENTVNTCHYFYRNGHMYLLIHEKYMSKNMLNFIRQQSMASHIGMIRVKQTILFEHKIRVMDIESHREQQDNSFVHQPLMIGHAEEKDRYDVFIGDDCLDRYFAWLRDQNEDMVVFAHNGGKYDFHVMAQSALKFCNRQLDQPIRVLDIDGRYIELTLYFDTGKTITFRDSYAILPSSLKKIANEFEVTNKMDDIDIVNVTRNDLLHDPRYVEYNRIDCIALLEVLIKYRHKCVEQFNTDPLCHPSASSYAKRVFYSRYYNSDKYPLYVLPRRVHEIIDRSYGGGRCEVLRRGIFREKPLYYYDINSSYPYAGTLQLPYGKPQEYRCLLNITPEHAKRFIQKHPGIYQVKVLRNGDGLPLHGVMTEGKYVFPLFDEISPSIHVFSEELLYGIEIGYQYQLIDGFGFEMACWGKSFFESLYHEKWCAEQNGNNALRWVYKIVANSGYGFFGYNKYDRQLTKFYGEHMKEHIECLKLHGCADYYTYDSGVIVSYEKSDVLLNDVNVAAATAITSYGRIHLHQYMEIIRQRGGDIYYCDTDSFITDTRIEDHADLSERMLGNRLGKLKNELGSDNYIEEAAILSCKLYGFRTSKPLHHGGCYVSHAKGVKMASDKLYTELISMLDEPRSFNVPQMLTGRVKKARGDLCVYDTIVTKELSGKYTKRNVCDSGETYPVVYR